MTKPYFILKLGEGVGWGSLALKQNYLKAFKPDENKRLVLGRIIRIKKKYLKIVNCVQTNEYC